MYVSHRVIESPLYQICRNISICMIQIYLPLSMYTYIYIYMTCRQSCRNQGLVLLLHNLMLFISSEFFYMGEAEERFKPFLQLARFQAYILMEQESLPIQLASHWKHQGVETLDCWSVKPKDFDTKGDFTGSWLSMSFLSQPN